MANPNNKSVPPASSRGATLEEIPRRGVARRAFRHLPLKNRQ